MALFGMYWCAIVTPVYGWKVEKCFCIKGFPVVMHLRVVIRCESKAEAEEMAIVQAENDKPDSYQQMKDEIIAKRMKEDAAKYFNSGKYW